MPRNRLQRGLRATLLGMGANAVLAGSKLTAGILGHSHALTADAIESLVDVFSSALVWRGLVVASEPADEDHPYGHGKAEPLASAGVSTLLLLGAAWICVQSTREALRPQTMPAPFTLAVLVAAALLKEGLFRFIRKESRSLNSSAMHADAWHHRSDALTSMAAGTGISVALLGGSRYAVADDIAAVAAAGIIAWNGWHILRGALHELMDRSPDPILIAEIQRTAAATPGVAAIEKCLVRQMGYQYYVDMHVQVDPQMTVQRSHEIAHEVKNKVRREFPTVRDVLVHIEPLVGPTPPRG